MDWTNWCRLCGSCEVMFELEASSLKMIHLDCMVLKLALNKLYLVQL